MELKGGGAQGRGRRTKFLFKEITVWNMHKSVNKLCRSYQHRIFRASQLSSEAPPACQHPSASHASQAYQHLGRLCHGQACLPRAREEGGSSGTIIPSPWYARASSFPGSHSATWLGPAVHKIEQSLYTNFGKRTQVGKV